MADVVISGVWYFFDKMRLNNVTLAHDINFDFSANNENFNSNNTIYTTLNFYHDASNQINQIEYDAFLVYDNTLTGTGWTNENYRYVDFGQGVTVDTEFYNLLTSVATNINYLTVSFKNDNLAPLFTQNVVYGNAPSVPSIIPDPSSELGNNYEFEGWSSAPQSSAFNEYDFTTPIYNDVTIYAHYKLKPAVTYIVEGNTYDVQYITTGELTSPPANPVVTDKEFQYWNDEDNVEFDFNTPITEDINLYALFLDIYTITFMNEGNIFTTAKVVDGNYLSKPNIDPTSSDELKFFKGWSLSSAEYDEYIFDAERIYGDMTLYAWYDTGHYVEFYNENKLYNKQIIKPNDKALKPLTDPMSSDPAKTFKGWSSNSITYIYFNFNTIITEDTVLYAFYETETKKVFDYINFLGAKLNALENQLELDNKILIGDERIFENSRAKEYDILVAVKFLGVSYEFNAKTQPIQITVLSEENSIENARLLFNTFAERNNWTKIDSENNPDFIDNTHYIKQQYSSPVIINSFAETGNGFRAVMLINANLFITDDILDLSDLTINDVNIKPLTFSLNYSMSGNTQQFPDDPISKTVKSTSTCSITMSLPTINYKGSRIENHIVTVNEKSRNFITISKSVLSIYVKNLISAKYENIDLNIIEYETYYKIDLIQGIQVENVIKLSFEYYLTKHFLSVSRGSSTGNDVFNLNFKIGDVPFEKKMKLIAFNFNTNPEQIPGFTINFLE